MRKCSRCKIEKPISEFYIRKTHPYCVIVPCKECQKAAARKWAKKNKEKVRSTHRNWSAKNPSKKKEQCKRYYEKHKIVIGEKQRTYRQNNIKKIHLRSKESSKRYRESHHELCKERVRDWTIKNKEKIKKRRSIYYQNNKEKHMAYYKERPEQTKQWKKNYYQKIKDNAKDKLNRAMHSRIYKSLRKNKSFRAWQDLVEYSITDLEKHLGKLFEPGMSWDNYGEWEIDHIIPLVVFNFSNPKDIDFKRCWALKNLRPLWAKDNRIKSAKLSAPFQPSFSFTSLPPNQVASQE